MTHKILLIFIVVFALILLLLKRNHALITIPYIIILFVFLFSLSLIWIYFVQKLKRKLKKIVSNNEPLLCYKSDYFITHAKQKLSIDRDVQFNTWEFDHYYLYFLELKNDVILEISKREFEKIRNEKFSSINVYFYKELLKDKRYEIEGIK